MFSVANDQNFIVGLFNAQLFVPEVGNLLEAAMHDGMFHRGIDGRDQQGVIDMLRPQVLQRLLGIGRLYIVAALNETVLGRNPQLELIAVAD